MNIETDQPFSKDKSIDSKIRDILAGLSANTADVRFAVENYSLYGRRDTDSAQRYANMFSDKLCMLNVLNNGHAFVDGEKIKKQAAKFAETLTPIFMLKNEELTKLAKIILNDGDTLRIPPVDIKGRAIRESSDLKYWDKRWQVFNRSDSGIFDLLHEANRTLIEVNGYQLVFENCDAIVLELALRGIIKKDNTVENNFRELYKYVYCFQG